MATKTPLPARRQVSVETPLGWLLATIEQEQVVAVTIVAERAPLAPARDAFARQVVTAFNGYFRDGRWPEGLPLKAQGTDFQQRVWACLRRIPTGHTRRYGAIAEELQSGARAVGNACRANPLLLLIPCHRVVAAHGRGGFAGQTQGRWPAMKDWLLAHEQGRA